MSDERISPVMMRTTLASLGVTAIAAGFWGAFTWERPHRAVLVAIAAGLALSTGAIAALPRRRLLAAPWSDAFFALWTLVLVVGIAVSASLDGGIRSPATLCLFPCVAYPALAYPRWAVALTAFAATAAVVDISLLHAHVSPQPELFTVSLGFNLAITGVLCVVQARVQERARGELEQVSRTDPLTGALNRLGLGERLDGELRRSRSGGEPVTLILLDLDDFKLVNDDHGHAAGDELLQWATGAMLGTLRPGDALARIGGDEFAVVLPQTGQASGERIAGRLTMALGERVAASAGVAASDCLDPGEDAGDGLYHHADRRLYAVKRGRDVRALAA